jgi:hypothetical protein
LINIVVKQTFRFESGPQAHTVRLLPRKDLVEAMEKASSIDPANSTVGS